MYVAARLTRRAGCDGPGSSNHHSTIPGGRRAHSAAARSTADAREARDDEVARLAPSFDRPKRRRESTTADAAERERSLLTAGRGRLFEATGGRRAHPRAALSVRLVVIKLSPPELTEGINASHARSPSRTVADAQTHICTLSARSVPG